ncbi:hypothetical protein [Nocardia jiangsuensis]|uniref:DUF2946 family protein n=1 Tax=Nocardia jiangsuensis TaxID=1691563 RepID=A0ABV8DMV7_9NOCA
MSETAGALLRSMLWATLAVAVLGMHHTPTLVQATSHSMPTVVAGHDDHHAMPASDSPSMAAGHGDGCCGQVAAGQTPSPGAGPAGEGHGGHDLLHLCLAIMTALAGVTLIVLALAWRGPAAVPRMGGGLRPGAFARPPPLPVARRLAVLCVLRQ